MKRLFSIIVAFLFLCSTSNAFMLTPNRIDYKDTITGLRISAVDGTAFIDNLPYTYSSDFSAGVDGWDATQGTADGNIDSIGGVDNWIRYTINTTNATHHLYKGYTFISGRKYTISGKYYLPSTNNIITSLKIYAIPQGSASSALNVLDTVTSFSYTFTATNATQLRMYVRDSDEYQDAGGDDVFYIKDVTISEITPYIDGNHSIEIYDSAGKFIKGVLKAAGTSEGLGSEKLTSWSNASFSTLTSSGSSISSLISSGTSYAAANPPVPSMALNILTKIILTPTSGTNLQYYIGDTQQNLSVTNLSSGTNTKYLTITSTSGSDPTKINIKSIGAVNTNMSTNSYTQVLTPSSSGATIVSAKQGAVYNWTVKNPSFTYNAASYYVVIKALR